jgi:hypothetical protein
MEDSALGCLSAVAGRERTVCARGVEMSGPRFLKVSSNG